MFAVHEVERGRVLIRNAEADFHWRQTGALEKFVVFAQQVDDFPSQHAGAPHAKHGFRLALEQGDDDGVAFEENFRRSVFCQELVDGIVEIQAEIGSGVHALFHERTGQARGVADVSLENYVMHNAIFGGLLVFGWQEFVQHVVHGRELANFVVADEVDAVETGVDGFEAAQIAVIAE